MNRTLTLLIASFMVFHITGCGGPARPEGMPRLYPASITVVQEGIPLAGAMVQLVSDEPDLSRWGPSGITDTAGVAVLKTNGTYDGAPLGKFKAIVSKREREPHPNPEWANLPDGDPNFQKYMQAEAKRKTINYIEAKYGSIADTPLTVEITAGGKTYSVDVGKQSKTEVKTLQ